jgi:P-loop Domain of unknown function (DUF2791)
MVVLSADLSVNHRLHATDGRGRALYSSLLANVRTKSCPSGNGLRPLMESWISSLGFDLGSVAAWFYNKEKLGLVRHWPNTGTYVVISQQPLLPFVSATLRRYQRWTV